MSKERGGARYSGRSEQVESRARKKVRRQTDSLERGLTISYREREKRHCYDKPFRVEIIKKRRLSGFGKR